MRLFIAINFNAETRLRLTALRDELRGESVRGRFSVPENLHLTLAFLGECDEKQTRAVKSAMDAIKFEPFTIKIDSIGRFRRDSGDIWWAGVIKSKELTILHGKLIEKLSESGFLIEKRRFSPHITFGREIVTKTAPRKFKEFGQTVDKIELMKSERIAGRLTYTAIHELSAQTGASP